MTCQSFDCPNQLNPALFGCCCNTKVTEKKNKKQFQKNIKHYEDKIDDLIKKINNSKKSKTKCSKSYHKKVNGWKSDIKELKVNIFQERKGFLERKLVQVPGIYGKTNCNCC